MLVLLTENNKAANYFTSKMGSFWSSKGLPFRAHNDGEPRGKTKEKKLFYRVEGRVGRGYYRVQRRKLRAGSSGFSLVQFSSAAQLCPTLWDPMNRSTPGLPVHHQLPEFTQTHIHWVGGAIQPSHPLSSPSPPDPNPSQHQGLFQWVNSLHELVKVLEFQL